MPKLKTRNSVAKRFKVTKTGKIMRGKSGARHLKMSKSKSNLRRKKEPQEVNHTFGKKIRKLMPYA